MCPGVESDTLGDCPKCGMALEAKGAPAEDDGDDQEIRALSRKFWIAAALIAMAHWIPGFNIENVIPKNLSKWIEFALTAPVVLWAGGMFFSKAWRSVKTWNLNMFTLIATGVGAAFIDSAVAVISPGVFQERRRGRDYRKGYPPRHRQDRHPDRRETACHRYQNRLRNRPYPASPTRGIP